MNQYGWEKCSALSYYLEARSNSPVDLMTRGQGIRNATGLLPIAEPAAREAL